MHKGDLIKKTCNCKTQCNLQPDIYFLFKKGNKRNYKYNMCVYVSIYKILGIAHISMNIIIFFFFFL